jgi:hypothetical protein
MQILQAARLQDNRQRSKTQPHPMRPLSTFRRFAKTARFHAAAAVTLAGLLLVLAFSAVNAQGEAQPALTRHVRTATQSGEAKLVGELPEDKVLKLDIVLSLRDPAGLDRFLKDLYRPGSSAYHHYLTVEQFTERFGPSQQDYDAVVRFAKENGFKVTGGTRDGMNVQVEAPIFAIESAFHVNMLTYSHPTEHRTFYAPDREPTADLPFRLWQIDGLDNFSLPRTAMEKASDFAKAHGISPDKVVSHAKTGSGPSQSFLGSDMRAAYYGSGPLNGAGQNLGLIEWAGIDANDLNEYYSSTGQTRHVTVELFSPDGTSLSCVETNNPKTACDDGEQIIDLTQALGMAPELKSLTMFISGNSTTLLAAASSHNPLPTTIGCSLLWSPADTSSSDPYLKKMAAQGQSFFAATGDTGDWIIAKNHFSYPGSDDWAIAVGGTDLVTAKAGGTWQSEFAWVDSSGGINPNGIGIPDWQHLPGVINDFNGGSVTLRNGPDVSANGNFTFYVCADQVPCTANEVGGTSFAAPMWAGYTALVNQQAKENGVGRAGFINPTIYALNTANYENYRSDFHDITSGANKHFKAVEGFDLVTGWGSPNSGLIDALAPPSEPSDLWNSIFEYTGTPCGSSGCPGWKELDHSHSAMQIATQNGHLYRLESNGHIWVQGAKSTGNILDGWTELDENPLAASIFADGDDLYQLHYDGSIWKSTGVPCTGTSCPGWIELDNNSGAVQITASRGTLFELHANGNIFRYTGKPCTSSGCSGWVQMDNNARAIAIASSVNLAYELHDDGSIWKSTGAACNSKDCPGWTMLDDNPYAVAIAVSDGNLYELHNTGAIYKSTGVACTGTSCPGWTKLDDNPLAVGIVADGSNVYELHSTGAVFKSTGVACTGNSCPGWVQLDGNAATTQIAAGAGQLYQLHGLR